MLHLRREPICLLSSRKHIVVTNYLEDRFGSRPRGDAARELQSKFSWELCV
jgi:hypothetical protein